MLEKASSEDYPVIWEEFEKELAEIVKENIKLEVY